MAQKLTVVINSLNEAENVKTALSSVREIASEIVIVDMESTDNIAEVAAKFKAELYKHKRLSYVEPARNFAIAKATGEWVLVLDADEEVPPELRKKIKEIIENGSVDYVRIPRKNIIFGHFMEHAHWWPDYNVRLFRKGKVTWSNTIHAVPTVSGKGIDIDAKPTLAILHHTYNSIEKYIEHLNRYTTVQAELKIKSGYKFKWQDMLLRPSNEFLSRFFGDEGYKDGPYGLALSLMQAFSELAFYLKIWQAEKFKNQEMPLTEVVSEMRERERDLHYWQGDSLYKETGDLKARVIRKLRI
jgi:(heptosyl)LPS beta-1,4-glucosyltransferase